MVKKQRYYTVIEMVTVIVILGLVAAMAVANFRRMPVFLSLESKVSDLKRLMAQARSNAVCRGGNTQLMFDAENRRFYLQNPEGKTSPAVYMPKEMKLKINGEEPEDESSQNTVFSFYPDGTGGGGSVTLQLKKHAFKVSISPLSGTIFDEEVKASE